MITRTDLTWIPTADVQVGDRVACLLSDASAYLVVTGWADRVLTLSRYGLDDVTHRTFLVNGRPWWADKSMRTFDLASKALIVARGGAQ